MSSKLYMCIIIGLALFVPFITSGCAKENPGPESGIEKADSQPVETANDEEVVVKPVDDATTEDETGAGEEKIDQNRPFLAVSQEDVTVKWIEKGSLKMKAVAEEFTGDEVTRKGVLKNFKAELYENGKLTAELSAPRAEANAETRVVIATGGVTLKSMERNTVVRAAWIKWFSEDERVVGNGGVKVESTMGTIESAAFEADTTLRKVTLSDSAKKIDY